MREKISAWRPRNKEYTRERFPISAGIFKAKYKQTMYSPKSTAFFVVFMLFLQLFFMQSSFPGKVNVEDKKFSVCVEIKAQGNLRKDFTRLQFTSCHSTNSSLSLKFSISPYFHSHN